MMRETIQKVLPGVLFLFCGCFSANCQSSTDLNKVLSQLDNGNVKNNVYENKLLGLRIPFPKSMTTDTRESLEADLKEGVELLKSEKPSDKRLLDEMIRKDRIVFSLDLPESEDSVGSAMSLTIKKDESNEPLGPMINRTIKFFTSSGKQKLAQPVSKTKIANEIFHTFSLSMDVEGGTVLSKLFVARRKGYLLTFSIAHSDAKGLYEMESVLKGLEFF